jgi:L-serine deaminase
MILELSEKGLVMHPAILAVTLSGQLATPVSDQVPKLNVEATCKASVEADNAMGLVLAQSFDKCMSDENSARQQLGPIWSSHSAAIRAQCEGEATAAGNASYVDLLVCLQMADGTSPNSSISLRGASRKKSPN